MGAALEQPELAQQQVTFTIQPPFNIDKGLAEKTFDAVILSVPAMDDHDEAGDLVPMSRVALARVGVGVVVQEGGPVPDVSTPEKLKAAVLAARSLTHTDPAIPNTSGAIAGAALAKLGILDEVKDKTRYAALAVGAHDLHTHPREPVKSCARAPHAGKNGGGGYSGGCRRNRRERPYRACCACAASGHAAAAPPSSVMNWRRCS
jgi:hypothetical protein